MRDSNVIVAAVVSLAAGTSAERVLAQSPGKTEASPEIAFRANR